MWEKLGYRAMQPSWALPKLLWLLDDLGRPGGRGLPAGTRLLHQADLITWRLAGRQVASDASHALKTGYDLIAERWPEAELDALGVPSALPPDVVRPGTVIGTVCADAAEATGIPAGTPISAGMTDGCAAQIGAGALTPGAWNAVLGTTLVFKGRARTSSAIPAAWSTATAAPAAAGCPAAPPAAARASSPTASPAPTSTR